MTDTSGDAMTPVEKVNSNWTFFKGRSVLTTHIPFIKWIHRDVLKNIMTVDVFGLCQKLISSFVLKSFFRIMKLDTEWRYTNSWINFMLIPYYNQEISDLAEIGQRRKHWICDDLFSIKQQKLMIKWVLISRSI